MARHAIPAVILLARVQAAVIAAQSRAWQRRDDALQAAPMLFPWVAGMAVERANWAPMLARLQIAFEGTSRGERDMRMVTPGRPWMAWLTRRRVQRFEICCDASDGWAPRLYIDGHAVDSPGMHPHP